MCFAFEGRVAVGDKPDGIDAELAALSVVVIRDDRHESAIGRWISRRWAD
jgi:hypothetical protein